MCVRLSSVEFLLHQPPPPRGPLLFMFCTQLSHLHTARRVEHLVHRLSVHSVMQGGEHALKPQRAVFTHTLHARTRQHTCSRSPRGGGCCRAHAEPLLKLHMKNAATNTRPFSGDEEALRQGPGLPLLCFRGHSIPQGERRQLQQEVQLEGSMTESQAAGPVQIRRTRRITELLVFQRTVVSFC